jgi:CheY-like chemotaxis protein
MGDFMSYEFFKNGLGARMAKILLIEDQSFTATIMQTVLKNAGHIVVLAKDGERGLAAFETDRPDVVITDIVLPQMDGLEVIRTIQKHVPGFPIIALTGGGNTGLYSYLDKAMELGALEVFRKPVTAEQLLDGIRRCLDLNPVP